MDATKFAVSNNLRNVLAAAPAQYHLSTRPTYLRLVRHLRTVWSQVGAVSLKAVSVSRKWEETDRTTTTKEALVYAV